MRAKSTPVGHSRLQPLHEMHSAIVSRMSSETSASGPSWPDKASRKVLARPRVRCCSSLVARKEGHMTPASRARQAPLLLHISAAAAETPHSHQFRGVFTGVWPEMCLNRDILRV